MENIRVCGTWPFPLAVPQGVDIPSKTAPTAYHGVPMSLFSYDLDATGSVLSFPWCIVSEPI